MSRLKRLRLERKEKSKKQKLEALKQQRINLLEQHLNVKLSSQEFKTLAEKLNFKRNRHLIKNPSDEIKSLGYTITNTRIDNKRYKIITK